MRKIIIVLLCAIMSLPLYAQEKTMNVYEGTFEEALQKVKTTGKPLFVVGGTPWVEACNYTVEVLMTNSQVVDFLNDKCIVYFIPVAQNQELDTKYGLGILPYFLILDGDGNVIHKFANTLEKSQVWDFITVDEFLNFIKQGLGVTTSYRSLNKRYEEGEREKNFMELYLNTLYNAFLLQECKDIFPVYFNALNDKQKWSPACFSLIQKIVDTPFHPAYEFLLKNKQKFVAKNGAMAVNDCIASIGCKYLERTYMTFNDRYSEEDAAKFRSMIQENKLENGQDLSITLDLMALRKKGDYSGMVDVISDVFKQTEHTKFICKMLVISSNVIKFKGDDKTKDKLELLHKQYETSEKPIYEIVRKGIPIA